MDWDQNLPDTSTWLPRANVNESLGKALLVRCKIVEQLIKERAKAEKLMDIDNFDSGLGIEDIFRQELTDLLPTRYSVHSGVIDDRLGQTAGDVDVIIFNDTWFPKLKSGATPGSRRAHYPIEGAYGLIEIKTTLGYKELDQAMEKMVSCHRLSRPATRSGRITENRREDGCIHKTSNPLYSAIVAISLKDNIEMELLINRFFSLCQTLKRREVVRSLCVLGEGCVTWVARNSDGDCVPATFMRDLDYDLVPMFHKPEESVSCLYRFITDLLGSLNQTILAPEEVFPVYSELDWGVSLPSKSEIFLPPDEDPFEFDRIENE